MQAVVTVVVAEEEVVAVEEEVAAAAEEEGMTMMTMTMMPPVHHLAEPVHPLERDAGFSTIKKWNSNWPKSCKINARWLRDDALPASRPPIPSQPRIRMDVGLP